MELIVISSPSPLAAEGRLINQLFQAGMSCFHLRKPDRGFETIRDLLGEIEPGYHDRIALHQFHEMAPELGITRLHYTEAARSRTPPSAFWKHRKAGCTLSTSIHQLNALNGLEHFDYAFYGPVFNSISKPGYTRTVPDNFICPKADHQARLIALGGIQACNLGKIKQMGFDGAAVLGTLWNDPHQTLQRFKQLKELSCEYL